MTNLHKWISSFTVCCLDSIIPAVAISVISRLAEQAAFLMTQVICDQAKKKKKCGSDNPTDPKTLTPLIEHEKNEIKICYPDSKFLVKNLEFQIF